MIGGLLKSTTGRMALLAAAGLFASGVAVPSAKAADLGGDCCADLEERVAELEATTARKGNRKMSLTVSGQITRDIMYWDDGQRSGVYAGLDNHIQSSRFIFSGSAKINPSLTAGFEFMTEWQGGARTSTVDQLSPDGNGAGTNFVANDGVLAVRTANWWLEDKTLGRVSVGRVNVGGPVTTIDLGGISTLANASPGLMSGGFFVTGLATTAYAGGIRMGSIAAPTYGGDRVEGIRYDSPSVAGFLLQATWGEDDVWSASLRYAGEFGGFRLAAGIGYEKATSNPFASVGQAIQLDNGSRNMDYEWAGSVALMHVASGLFVQGHYAMTHWINNEDSSYWAVQGGIAKNWFGIGITSLYGEYGVMSDYIKSGVASNTIPPAAAFTPAGFPGAESESKYYGIGIVQQIDAAAMEVYLGWRRFDNEVSTAPAAAGGLPAASVVGDSTIDIVRGGARIRF